MALIDPAPRTFFGVPAAAPGGPRRPGGVPGRPVRRRHAAAGDPDRPARRPAAVRAAGEATFAYGEGWYDVERRPRPPRRRDDGGRRRRRDPGLGHRQELRAHHGRGARHRRARRADGRDRRRPLDQLPAGPGMEPLGPFDVVATSTPARRLPRRAGRRAAHRREPARDGWRSCRTSAPSPRSGSATPTASEVDGLRALGGRWATSLDVIERGAREVRPRDRAGGAGAVRLDRPRRARLRDRAGPLAAGAGRAGLPPAAAILAEVARRGRVIGFDVVELDPARDPSGATARVAAWVVTHFLGEILDAA